MMIIEIDRSHEGEQRKLLSDSCMRVIGIRQEEYAGREILYIHTKLNWQGEEEGLPGNLLDITANLDAAIKALRDSQETIRSHLPQSSLRAIQLAEISVAIDKLKAISAPEMIMKAGQWFAVTEANDDKRRKAREARAAATTKEKQ